MMTEEGVCLAKREKEKRFFSVLIDITGTTEGTKKKTRRRSMREITLTKHLMPCLASLIEAGCFEG
jgi:hypothetical protein